MRKSIVAGAAITASLAFAGTAQAENFNGFADGSVGGQFDWTADAKYDQRIVDVEGNKKLRISNAVADGSFSDLPYSAPVAPAGENAVNNVLISKFTFESTTGEHQPGLVMSVSPTGAGGSRMSYVQLKDTPEGIQVNFNDNPYHDSANFVSQTIATVDHDSVHSIKFETKFVPGTNNDVVRVSVDGTEKVCGTTWENYYRHGELHAPSVTDRLMWRLGSKPADGVIANLGNGFLFDNVTTTSQVGGVDNCPLPVGPQGPQGPQGEKGNTGATGATGANGAKGADGTNGSNGTNGVNGKDGAAGSAGKDGVNGVTTIIREYGKVSGARMRTVYAPKSKGKFVAVRAKLRGKSLPTSGRSIKVDLRGKSVGNYIVRMVAKYKKGGKTYKVRGIRSLNIVRK